MIATKALEKILKATFFTAYIEGENALSLMIVARVESGKTKLAAMFHPNAGIKFFTDATAYGIWRDFHKEIERGKIKHIIFPDLLTPLSKSYETRRSFVMFLSGLMEEGIAEIHTGFLEPIALRAPSTVGIVACVARDSFADARRGWAKIGFISRMLPVSFEYSADTISAILRSIAQRTYMKDAKIKLNFPSDKVPVELPLDIAECAIEAEKDILNTMPTPYAGYGFRMLHHVQRLLLGLALADDRLKVTWEDFKLFDTELKPYLGLRYKEI